MDKSILKINKRVKSDKAQNLGKFLRFLTP